MEAKGGLSVDDVHVEDGRIPELEGYWAFDEKGFPKRSKV